MNSSFIDSSRLSHVIISDSVGPRCGWRKSQHKPANVCVCVCDVGVQFMASGNKMISVGGPDCRVNDRRYATGDVFEMTMQHETLLSVMIPGKPRGRQLSMQNAKAFTECNYGTGRWIILLSTYHEEWRHNAF